MAGESPAESPAAEPPPAEPIAERAGEVGLQLHMGKTKILSSARVRRGVSAAMQVKVGMQQVEVLAVDDSVMYLGKKFCMGENHHDVEIEHRLARAWAKFVSYKNERCSRHYSLAHRLRLFDATVTPTVLYACGSWTMIDTREKKLRTVQRKMIRWIVGMGRRQEGGAVGEMDFRRPRVAAAEPIREKHERVVVDGGLVHL